MTSITDRFKRKKNSEQIISAKQEEKSDTAGGQLEGLDSTQAGSAQHDPHAKAHLEIPQFNVGIAQSPGVQRSTNEDALFTLTTNLISNQNTLQVGLYIIADGMGGYENGEIASRIAVEKFSTHVIAGFYQPLFTSGGKNPDFSIQEIMKSGVIQAHQAIKKDALGAGSTLTAALILGNQMTIAHVGDSRAYMFYPDGSFQLLTKDHSLVKRLEDIGEISAEEASTHPQRNVLYRALGQGEPFEPDISSISLQPGSQLMLCTDGLWGVISEKELLTGISSSRVPAHACQSLVDQANAAGGPDNISIILVGIPG